MYRTGSLQALACLLPAWSVHRCTQHASSPAKGSMSPTRMEMNDRELRSEITSCTRTAGEASPRGPLPLESGHGLRVLPICSAACGWPSASCAWQCGRGRAGPGVFEITLQVPVKIQCDNALLSGTYWIWHFILGSSMHYHRFARGGEWLKFGYQWSHNYVMLSDHVRAISSVSRGQSWRDETSKTTLTIILGLHAWPSGKQTYVTMQNHNVIANQLYISMAMASIY